jgi:hypothetical protein
LNWPNGEGRIVITEDLDFGKLYYHFERGQVGIIVLRLRVQSAAAVNQVVGRFFADPTTAGISLERSLVVIDDSRVRVSSEPLSSCRTPTCVQMLWTTAQIGPTQASNTALASRPFRTLPS